MTPSWVPKHLSKTVGGQAVGWEPLMCEPKGASDYCMHCGKDMCIGSGPPAPCASLEGLRLAMIPDDAIQVEAFGCHREAFMVGLGGDPDEVKEARCAKWCKTARCPVSMRRLDDAGGSRE